MLLLDLIDDFSLLGEDFNAGDVIIHLCGTKEVGSDFVVLVKLGTIHVESGYSVVEMILSLLNISI